MSYGNDHDHRGEYAPGRHDHDLDYAEKHHRHYDDENRISDVREDLSGAEVRIYDMDREIGEVRAELRQFKEYAAANLASLNELAAELTIQVSGDPDFAATTVGVLRALTFNLGYQFRGETRPGDWDPDAEYARLAGETEADKPAQPLRKLEESWEPDDCIRCGDPVATLSTDGLCDGCVAENAAEPDGPEIPDFDPGPQVDDQGGMSEYRYLTAADEG